MAIPPDPPETHMMRVSHPVYLSLRLLNSRLEALAGRRVNMGDSLRVAVIAAENAPDSELLAYLQGEEQ
jgi:hypothetical protein